jgi:hypothetical protein
MPDEVLVDKAELLGVLRANRAIHREVFLKAQQGFRERAITELDRSLADARAGNDVRLAVHLPEPQDHTDDYDREIRMLEMHTEPTVRIRAGLFDQIVMDRWGWSAAFNATSSAYLPGLAGGLSGVSDGGCEWQNIYRRCCWPASGFRYYSGRWLRVCWLHHPAELVLAG